MKYVDVVTKERLKAAAPVMALALVAVIVLATAIAGCASANKPSYDEAIESDRSQHISSSVSGLHKDGVLTVGLRSSSNPPIVSNVEGDVSGLDVDVACALADALGVQVSFLKASDIKDALASHCDIVMDVNAAEVADIDGVEVIGDLSESAVALFHVGDSEVVSAEDLNDKTIALQEGSSSQRLLQSLGLKVKEVTCGTIDAAFDTLSGKDADFALCHAASGGFVAIRHKGVSFAGTLNEPVTSGIAISTANEDLAKSLREAYERIETNGVLGTARRAWLGDLPKLTAESRVTGLPEAKAEDAEKADAPALDAYEAENVNTGAMDGSNAGANAALVVSEE